jgi:hypothetical protein
MASPVVNPDQVIGVESTTQVAGATVDSPPVESPIQDLVLLVNKSPVMDATSVASNTLLVAPVVTNNPLTTTPPHGRYYQLRKSKC